ncbi:MAG: protein kinase [Thiotrichaceae bacterium]
MSNSNTQNSQPVQSGFALPIGYTFQDYKINQVVAEDDYSISYLATEQSQNTEVILKEYLPRSLSQRDSSTYDITPKTLLSKQSFEWGLSEYREEIYDLININHPNIINVTSYFEAHNTAYKVIDAIDGVTLEQYAQDKALSEAEILSLIEPLLDGLEAIHTSGHIHSDLTPAHILIQDEISMPVMTHLGDASHIFRHHEKEIPLLVSPGYSPCEHYYANDKQGVWTDIYAVGCILYRLISGVTPHSSASRLTGIADHNKDPLTPASEIAQGAGTHTYSKQLLSAIDHAIQLQRRDRPQTISEWKNELGIETESIIEIDELSLINSSIGNSDLNISGVPTAPDSFSSHKEIAINFEAISQPTPEEPPSKLKQFARMAAFASVVLASLVGSYHYFTQPQIQDGLTKTHDVYVTNSKKTVIAQPPAELSQRETTDSFVEYLDEPAIGSDINSTINPTINPTIAPITTILTPEELALESTMEPSSREELLIVPAIENTDENTAPEEDSIAESALETPFTEDDDDLTPLWLLDVPLTKDELSLQQFEDAFIANEIITLPIILRYANEPDAEVEQTEIITLTNLMSNPHEVPNIVITTAITPTTQAVATTSQEPTKTATKVITSNTTQKVAGVVRNNHQTRPTSRPQPRRVHRTTHHRNKKSRNKKTRQQYQKEWVAEQRRKKSQGKTKQQYQKEWAAKQNQLKKRAAWKRKKEHLKKVKIRKTVRQIEKGLLDEKDW